MSAFLIETARLRAAAILAAMGMVLIALLIPASSAEAMGMSYIAYHADSGARVREGDFVARGDKLSIHIRYLNNDASTAPAGALIFGLPDGCGLTSAAIDDRLSYSVDGGRSFGVLGSLWVMRDGHLRPARGSDVTHVRLHFEKPVLPGQGGEVRVVAALR